MIRGLTALALGALLSGCAALLQNAPGPALYTLEAPALPAASAGDDVLRMRLTAVAPGYEQPLMAYREGDALALRYFATARWVSAPGELVIERLGDALEATGRFRAVLTGPPPPVADYRLELELLRLEQDYRDGGAGVARLALRTRLLARDGELLAQQRLETSAPAAATGPAAAAAAANRALAELAVDLHAWLNRELPAR